ncbi:MAG: hypothetical protein OEY44_01875, partial [Candidatus Peregrinibacteria bacterium]|nr:hypothetical protein [Candidatus Peregrinibacteria bacterium]
KLMNRTFLKDGTKGGDDRLDVYIAPMASSLALTYCEGNPPCSSFILVASNIGAAKDDVLKTTFAHELFHAYQYAYKYKEPADDWWSESTATWAEDFIYPAANTEQGYLRGFILRPDVGLAFKEKVGLFQYGAYIFPYFLSFNYGDDFMSKTWEGCESGRCDKGVDGVIDGGFKKQWQEFTLWNYNRDPAQFYTDVGPFPTLSSIDAQEAGQVITDGTSEDKINTELLSPLSAHLVKVINIADNKKINKLTFKDLRKFTGRSDKLAIKAIINYANGRKEVEDWTDKDKRSFCIESSEENFENVILIFSSAELDKEFDDVDVTVVGKDNCFNISQEEDRTAVVHFPYADGGVHKTVDINTTIETNSWGEPEEEAEEGQEYAYLTEWRVRNEFEQVKEAFTMDCQGSTVDYGPGWKTRSAGYIVFDLGPEGLSEDGTFSVDFDYGYAHPRGQYEEVPAFTATCAGVGVGAQNIDLSSYKLYMEDIWQGRIFDMTKDGAKIEIFNSCLYHDCTTQQGAPFQTISEPVILEIRRGSE